MLFVYNICRSKNVSINPKLNVSPDNYYRFNIHIFKMKPIILYIILIEYKY